MRSPGTGHPGRDARPRTTNNTQFFLSFCSAAPALALSGGAPRSFSASLALYRHCGLTRLPLLFLDASWSGQPSVSHHEARQVWRPSRHSPLFPFLRFLFSWVSSSCSSLGVRSFLSRTVFKFFAMWESF